MEDKDIITCEYCNRFISVSLFTDAYLPKLNMESNMGYCKYKGRYVENGDFCDLHSPKLSN